MAAKKKAAKTTKKVTKKASSRTPAKKKVATKKASDKQTAAEVELKDLDRKGLAARARQIKTELLAIRFNFQAPSLKDYRKKRRELANVLAQLD